MLCKELYLLLCTIQSFWQPDRDAIVSFRALQVVHPLTLMATQGTSRVQTTHTTTPTTRAVLGASPFPVVTKWKSSSKRFTHATLITWKYMTALRVPAICWEIWLVITTDQRSTPLEDICGLSSIQTVATRDKGFWLTSLPSRISPVSATSSVLSCPIHVVQDEVRSEGWLSLGFSSYTSTLISKLISGVYLLSNLKLYSDHYFALLSKTLENISFRA